MEMRGFCLLWILMRAVSLGAALPDAQDLVDRMVVRDAEMVVRRAPLTYTLETVRHKLDKNGAVTSTTRETQQMRGNARIDYGTRDDRGVEQDLERASKEEPFELISMLHHYTFRTLGEERVQGEPCWKVAFTPKPGMPFKNREEKVLNHTSGTLWIHQEDFSLMRSEGRLMKPVSVAWFLATLGEMEFRYDSRKLPNGDYGPASVIYQFKVNVLFAEIRERHERKMTNYR